MKGAKFIQIIFFISLFLFFLLTPFDPNLGWQLRCGQLIWQEKNWCSQNQFSVLMPNYSWPNHHWLYQVVLYPLFKLSGFWGLSIFNAFLITLTFLFFYFSIKKFDWEKMIAIGVIIFFSWGVFHFGIRSQLIGFFFFNLILWLFSQLKKRPWLMVGLPLITLFWANSHGSVILGIALIFFLGLAQIVKSPRKSKFLTLMILFSLTVTLINPSGFKIYQEAWRHFAGIKLKNLIAEWVPPKLLFSSLIFASSLGLFIFLLIISEKREKIKAFFILPFSFLALQARRHLPFYFTFAFWLFLTSSTSQKIFKPWLEKKILQENLIIFTAILFLFLGLFLNLPQTIKSNSSWSNYCQSSKLAYPCQAIKFLKKQPGQGNLFNRYEWGGFLIWQLPEQKIFVDGRMPAWPTPSGKSPYTLYLETLQTQPGWQKTLKDYQIEWLLISPKTFMDLKLKPDPKKFGWQEVYRDQVSVIYQKTK